MAGNKKPGRKQRKERVVHALDGMAVMLGRRKQAVLARQRADGLMLTRAERAALGRGLEASVDAIVAGAGLAAHYNNLFSAALLSQILCERHIGAEHAPVCSEALEGLARMNERAAESGRLDFDALGLPAVRRVVWVHCQQIMEARKDQIAWAIATMNERVAEARTEQAAELAPA